jgi:hypothetical protein
MNPQPPELLDMYRAGLKSAVELMKTSLENAERMQSQHLVAIRTVLEQQQRSAEEMMQAKSLDELMALQTRLAGAQMEAAMGYWTGMCQAMLSNGQSAAKAASQRLNRGSGASSS